LLLLKLCSLDAWIQQQQTKTFWDGLSIQTWGLQGKGQPEGFWQERALLLSPARLGGDQPANSLHKSIS